MDAIEGLLLRLGVAVLSLPAASAAIPTWIHHFAFRPMDLLDVQAVQSELRMLMFPGSQILYKTLGPQSPEGPFAFAAASAKACQAPPAPTRNKADGNDLAVVSVAAPGVSEAKLESDLMAWLQDRARLRSGVGTGGSGGADPMDVVPDDAQAEPSGASSEAAVPPVAAHPGAMPRGGEEPAGPPEEPYAAVEPAVCAAAAGLPDGGRAVSHDENLRPLDVEGDAVPQQHGQGPTAAGPQPMCTSA
jgi:hypothetical protein